MCIGTASAPAVTRSNELTNQKKEQCKTVVEHVFSLLELKTRTRDIMTKEVSGAWCECVCECTHCWYNY